MIAKIIAFISSIIMFFNSLPFIAGSNNINAENESNILPETWAMTDGLGRTLSSAEEVKEKDDTKFVGLFYWTWHTNFSYLTAKNATEILAKHPEIKYDFNSPLWEYESSYPDGRPFSGISPFGATTKIRMNMF